MLMGTWPSGTAGHEVPCHPYMSRPGAGPGGTAAVPLCRTVLSTELQFGSLIVHLLLQLNPPPATRSLPAMCMSGSSACAMPAC